MGYFYDLTFLSNSFGYMYEPSTAKKVPNKMNSAYIDEVPISKKYV